MVGRLTRREFLHASSGYLAAVALAACSPPSASGPTARGSPDEASRPSPTRAGPPCRLGASAADIEALEGTLGAPLGMERLYHSGEEWPDRRERRALAQGRLPFATFKSFEGNRRFTWPEVAAGAFDEKLRRIAAGVVALKGPIILDYHAEPEAEEGTFGSREDYVKALRHIVRLFHREGIKNVRWGWCLMGFRFEDTSAADSWNPGDEYIDVVAADAYNWAGCVDSPEGAAGGGWTSFPERFGAAVAYASARGKNFIAAEVGCPEDPSDQDRKALWIAEMGDFIRSRPHVKGLCWYHHGRSEGYRCDWWIDSSPQSLRAFRELMAEPFIWTRGSAGAGPGT